VLSVIMLNAVAPIFHWLWIIFVMTDFFQSFVIVECCKHLHFMKSVKLQQIIKSSTYNTNNSLLRNNVKCPD
jgi:hypothetical protein